MMILILIVLLIIALPVIITLLPLILPLGFILLLNGVHPGSSPELATAGLPFSQWFWANPGMSMFMLACPLLVAASWTWAWWRGLWR